MFALPFQLSPRKRSLGAEWFLGRILFASLHTRLRLSDIDCGKIEGTCIGDK